MRKLLGLLILLAPLCAHAQFAKIQGGPLVGNCNPHTLGMDFVNNNIYECDGEPVPQWKLVGGINNQGIIPVLLRTNSPNCTTTNQLVQYDPGQVDSSGIGEVTNAAISSTGVIGVVISGAGCSGIATIATYLSAQCITDNQSTVGDLVSPSTTVPGQCHDYGSSLATGVQTVGRVSKANTGQGTASQVDFFLGNQLASGSTGVGTVSNCGTPGGIAYYVTAGSVVGCDPNFTTDGSGNWTSHSGTVNDTSHAGYLNVIQGAAPPTAPTNGVQLTVPTSVTGYSLYLPGTKPTSGDCANWSAISGQIQITDSGSPCGGSGGGVSTFSSGNLSPLFTTSVANPTTTPALSFSLSNAAANSYLGNTSNSLAAPSFLTIPACANDGAHALVYISGTGLACESITGAGASPLTNPSAPTVTPTGTTGATNYSYLVVGCQDVALAHCSAVSSIGSTSTGNATLSTINYNALTGYADTLYGYRGYIICRTFGGASQGIITSGLLAGKKFNDTGLAGNGANCASLYASNNTNTTPVCLGSALPGYPSTPGFPCGVDGPPLTPNALDAEAMETFGAPGDVNNPFWTWVNQGSATAAWSNGALVITSDSTASNNAEMLAESSALPSTPYTFVGFMDSLTTSTTGGCFIGLRESSTAKMASLFVFENNTIDTLTANGGAILGAYKWTNNTTNASIHLVPYFSTGVYVKIQNDGTNINISWSPVWDGVAYRQLGTTTIASAYTTAPNQLVVGTNSATVGATCLFDYIRRVQ